MQDVQAIIRARERDVAMRDMKMVEKLFKSKYIIFNPIQPILLDFIKDPFIAELLPLLTQYIELVDKPEYQRQALNKAKDIIAHLKELNAKVVNGAQQRGPDDIPDIKRYKDLRNDLKIMCIFSQDDLR